MKVGPFSKQIMNYSYPPLLYQRGDDSEEDEGEDEEDEEEDSQNSNFQLDEDDVFNMENLMGQDLDDLDHNNADLKQQEQVIDGLFRGEAAENDDGSPDGIENVDISDIQKMINKSCESPGLEEVDQEMLEGMDFINEMSGSPEKEDLDFYNNLQRVDNDRGAVGAAVD